MQKKNEEFEVNVKRNKSGLIKAVVVKKKRPKLDPRFVAVNQKYELDYIVELFRVKYHVTVTAKEIRGAVKSVGHSRIKVYAYLRPF